MASAAEEREGREGDTGPGGTGGSGDAVGREEWVGEGVLRVRHAVRVRAADHDSGVHGEAVEQVLRDGALLPVAAGLPDAAVQ